MQLCCLVKAYHVLLVRKTTRFQSTVRTVGDYDESSVELRCITYRKHAEDEYMLATQPSELMDISDLDLDGVILDNHYADTPSSGTRQEAITDHPRNCSPLRRLQAHPFTRVSRQMVHWPFLTT
jgi:hypothetical protein